jgi:hypothetical protein
MREDGELSCTDGGVRGRDQNEKCQLRRNDDASKVDGEFNFMKYENIEYITVCCSANERSV